MTDLICRKTMMRCQTQGMCAPFGGCQPSVLADCKTTQSNSSEATSPAGVDGLDVVQAVAWLNTVTKVATTHPVVVMDWDDEKEPVESLMQISQHEAIIDGLRGENGKLQDQLHTTQLKVGRYADQRDQLAGLLRKAALHVRPTCSDLYDEFMAALAELPK